MKNDCSVRARTLLLLAILCLSAQAQYPGWQVSPGAAPYLQGSTPGATLRNASQAVRDQVQLTRRTAGDLGRSARNPNYQTFYADYQRLRYQFQGMRSTFNLLAGLASQLQDPRTANALAELDAGLNIIAEAFNPVDQEVRAGMVNRDTVIRMSRILDDALNVWDRELKKNSSRLNFIW